MMWRRLQSNLYLALAWATLPRGQYERYRDSIRGLEAEIDKANALLERLKRYKAQR